MSSAYLLSLLGDDDYSTTTVGCFVVLTDWYYEEDVAAKIGAFTALPCYESSIRDDLNRVGEG